MPRTRPASRRGPAHLGAAGRAFWRQIVAEYEPEIRDLALLEAACVALDRAAKAAELIAAEGLVIEGPRGGTRPHPAVAIERGATRSFLQALKQLGLEGEPEQARTLRGRFTSIQGGLQRRA